MPRRRWKYFTRSVARQLRQSLGWNGEESSRPRSQGQSVSSLPRLRPRVAIHDVIRARPRRQNRQQPQASSSSSSSSSASSSSAYDSEFDTIEHSSDSMSDESDIDVVGSPSRENDFFFSDVSDEEMFEGFGAEDDDEIGMDRFAEVIVFLESGDFLNSGSSTSHSDDCYSDDGDLPDDPFQRELRGSMPEPTMSLHAAAVRGDTKELMRWKLWKMGQCGKKVKKDTPLHCAARAGDVGTVEQLIAEGASLSATNVYDHSALEIAARHGHAAVVKCLLKHGAGLDPDELDRAYEVTKSWSVVEALRERDPVDIRDLNPEELEKSAPWVNQMLFRVVQKGRVNMLKGLLIMGANANCSGILGWTPLQIASRRGHIQCVSVLLDYGAQVTSRDDFKWTALHYAAREGHQAIALLLLGAGADLEAKCRTGRTPCEVATDESTRELLRNYKDKRATNK